MTHRTDTAERSIEDIRSTPPGRPFVVAQLGQSLDGRIATVTGHSRWINGAAALDHLHALRAAVDAVVVGVGTIIADDPQLTVRRVAGADPSRVVIDPTGRAPASARCFLRDGTPRYRILARPMAQPDGIRPIILPRGADVIPRRDADTMPRRDADTMPRRDADTMPRRDADTIPPAAIVEALFALGMRRILIEGGADTISRFIDAGMVDRLHVLLAPVILGSGKAGLDLAPIRSMKQAIRPACRVHVFPDGDVLFDCDLRV